MLICPCSPRPAPPCPVSRWCRSRCSSGRSTAAETSRATKRWRTCWRCDGWCQLCGMWVPSTKLFHPACVATSSCLPPAPTAAASPGSEQRLPILPLNCCLPLPQKFYSDPDRYAYSFQHYVLLSRVREVGGQLLQQQGRAARPGYPGMPFSALLGPFCMPVQLPLTQHPTCVPAVLPAHTQPLRVAGCFCHVRLFNFFFDVRLRRTSSRGQGTASSCECWSAQSSQTARWERAAASKP